MVSSAFSSVAFDPDGYTGMCFKVAKSHFGIKNFLSVKNLVPDSICRDEKKHSVF